MTRRRWLLVVGLLGAAVALVLYLRVDRGPHGAFPPIAEEYYACEKCDSLDGGTYGKGPNRRFRTETGGWCVHRWQPIDRAEFRRQAAERFGTDWPGDRAGGP
jgi:hypothetical protein